MRALVTGCAGFVGSHLTEALLDGRAEVVGIDCFNDNYGRAEKLRNLARAREWDNFDFVPIDLARGDLHDVVADCDAVFHLAAEPGVRSSWGRRFESYVRNNVVATQHLLEAARTWPGKRFVYASSSSVYGQAERMPTPESATPAPLSPYGVTKLAGEQLCRLYHANHGVAAVCLRYFSVFGPRQRPDMAFARFLAAALDRAPIEVLGDGRQTRDFTYVGDVVPATLAAGERADAVGATINVGGGARVPLRAALEVIAAVAGRPLDVRHVPDRAGDVRDTAADVSLARALLDYAPSTGLEDGLEAQWQWVAAERLALHASAGGGARVA